MRRFFGLVFGLFFVTSVYAGDSVSLVSIIQESVRQSEVFKAYVAQLEASDYFQVLDRSAFSSQLSAELSYAKDGRSSAGTSFRNKSDQTRSKWALRKKLPFGAGLEGAVSTTQLSDTSISGFSVSSDDSHDVSGALTFSQSLLKNRFGSLDKLTSELALVQDIAAANDIKLTIRGWLDVFLDRFFKVLLLQMELDSSVENKANKTRIFEVVKEKNRFGNVKQRDFLLAEAEFLSSRSAYRIALFREESAMNELAVAYGVSVTQLRDWMGNFDTEREVDDVVNVDSIVGDYQFEGIVLDELVSQLSVVKADLELAGSLDLKTSLGFNGVGTSQGSALRRFGDDGSSFSVSAVYSRPFGFVKERASLDKQVRDHRLNTELLVLKKEGLQTEFDLIGAQFRLRQDNRQDIKQAYLAHKQRFDVAVADYTQGNISVSEFMRISEAYKREYRHYFSNLIELAGLKWQLLLFDGALLETLFIEELL